MSRCFLGPRRAVALHDEARAAFVALRRVGRSAETAPCHPPSPAGFAALVCALLRADDGQRHAHAWRRVQRPARGAPIAVAYPASTALRLKDSCARLLPLQVAGAAQLPLSLPRRALLIALQSAVPYWLERERCVGRCTAARAMQLTCASRTAQPARASPSRERGRRGGGLHVAQRCRGGAARCERRACWCPQRRRCRRRHRRRRCGALPRLASESHAAHGGALSIRARRAATHALTRRFASAGAAGAAISRPRGVVLLVRRVLFARVPPGRRAPRLRGPPARAAAALPHPRSAAAGASGDIRRAVGAQSRPAGAGARCRRRPPRRAAGARFLRV